MAKRIGMTLFKLYLHSHRWRVISYWCYCLRCYGYHFHNFKL